MIKKEYYTYLHRNNSGCIFYIGCSTTSQRKGRVRSKLPRAYSTSGHTPAWDEIASNGYTVEILSFFDTKSAAFAEEVSLITHYRENGEPLVNICSGGAGANGLKDSDETRKKKSITKVGALNPMYGIVGWKHPISRPVIHTQAGVFYDSVDEAAIAFGYKMKTLYNWLSGHRPNPTPLRFA